MEGSPQAPPVKVGETYEVSIDAVGGKGDGIGKVKGFVIFVPGVKKGDYLKIRITKVLQNVGFGEAVEKLDRPAPRPSRFVTFTHEDLKKSEPEPDVHYEESDDFGEDE
jgi:predicted RNA-binding protein with TRAM domain